jgi:hypothetical protein
MRQVVGLKVELAVGRAKGAIKERLRRQGYDIHAYAGATQDEDERGFLEEARRISAGRGRLTAEDESALAESHSAPLFGQMRVWDLVVMLARVIDPTDTSLYCVSQLTHSLQMAEAMQADGVADRDMILAALLHDTGKLALLTGEPPESFLREYAPVSEVERGVGLDDCPFSWSHGPLAYTRLKDHLPDHVAWLIRHHSIDLPRYNYLMNERDITYHERYMRAFQHYDAGTKSVYHQPRAKL